MPSVLSAAPHQDSGQQTPDTQPADRHSLQQSVDCCFVVFRCPFHHETLRDAQKKKSVTLYHIDPDAQASRFLYQSIQLSVSVFWMIFSASVGRAAKNRNALAMCVYPQIRRSVRTVLRRAAMTCGMLPHRTCEASSPRSTSRVRWERFSIAQCPRRICNKRLAVA